MPGGKWVGGCPELPVGLQPGALLLLLLPLSVSNILGQRCQEQATLPTWVVASPS